MITRRTLITVDVLIVVIALAGVIMSAVDGDWLPLVLGLVVTAMGVYFLVRDLWERS